MMSLWMATVLLAVSPGEGPLAVTAESPTAPALQRPVVEPRTGPELRDAVREALARFARPTDEQADHAARVFVVLYRELQQDDALASSQREAFRLKVRSRLIKLAAQIRARLAREQRLARQEKPASIEVPKRDETLGQFGGGFGGMGGGMGGFGGGMGGGMGGMGMGMGGPGMGMGMGMGGNALVGDASQELIDLIQKTIAPASWDVNGGPGSIYYFRPGHAMVISNTEEVHGQVNDVLDQLRRMNR